MKKAAMIYFYGYCVIDLPLGDALNLVEKLVKVETKGYGKDMRAVETEESTFDFQIIDEAKFIRQTDEIGMVEHLKKKAEEAEKSYNDANTERWKVKGELDKVKAELEAIKSVCPDSHNKEDNKEE